MHKEELIERKAGERRKRRLERRTQANIQEAPTRRPGSTPWSAALHAIGSALVLQYHRSK